MINCSYIVDGVSIQFLKYQIFTDNETVILYTNARLYNYRFDQMAEVLRGWIPIIEEGLPSYDHLFAEMGLEPLPDNPNLLPTQPENKDPDNELDDQTILVRTLLLDLLQNQNKELKEFKSKLSHTILNLKDEKNTLGKAYTEQAKQVINAVNANTKLTALQYEMIIGTLKLLGTLKPEESKGKKKGK